MRWDRAKSLSVVIIGLWSLLSMPGQVMADKQTFYVQPPRAHVRTSPAIEPDNVLDTLPQGTPIIAFEPEDGWYPVQLEDGRSGWMHRSVLRLSLEQPPPSPLA